MRETLLYLPDVRAWATCAPDGAAYVIGRPNDVIIVERAGGRAWSLRRERAVPQRV